jgi:general secretion pathway protein N
MSRRWGWFWLGLALALPVGLPLPLALDWLELPRFGLAAREAEGSLWSGRLRGASWRGQALGDLQLALQPLPLLSGTRALRIEGEARSLRLLQGRRNGVDGVEGAFAADGPSGLPGVGVELQFTRFALVFAGNRCLRAEGALQASLTWPGHDSASAVLSGSPQCAERAAVLPLRSAGGSARIEAEVRIEADGRYRMQSVVRDADPAVSAVLRQAGFVAGPAGLSQTRDGRLGY